MLSDIEIAQATTPQHISKIAEKLGIDFAYVEPYGNYKAKVDYNILDEKPGLCGKEVGHRRAGRSRRAEGVLPLHGRHGASADREVAQGAAHPLPARPVCGARAESPVQGAQRPL